MIHLPDVLEAAVEVQKFCHERKWRFCFIGGVAVQRWGSPRVTQDVDLTLLTGLGNEESFIDPRNGNWRQSSAVTAGLNFGVTLQS